MKMKLLAILALLLLFIIPGCGDDSGVAVNPAPSPVGASTVQGTVYGTDGQPVGTGITVRLTPNVASVTASENYGQQQTTTTDAQGGFSFTVHYAGTYFIDALDGTQLLGGQFLNVTGAGQVINILLGKPTGKLTVNIVPADANTTVTVEPGGDLTTSASPVTGSQTGEYIFYLAPGLYTVYAEATGYNPVDPQSVTIAEGGEQTLTFDFTVDGEIPVSAGGIDPCACINTGEVPVKYYVENFTGTGTIEFILKSTGEVIHSLSVTESDLVEEEDNAHYFSFTINTTAMPTGSYNVKLTHNPPVIGESSTTDEQGFYISNTIQGAIDEASNIASSTLQEIITPWGEETGYYRKVYIPAGNYYYANAGDFHKALPVPYIEAKSQIYIQGAGRDNTILDIKGNSSGGLYGFIDMHMAYSGAIEGFTIKGCAEAGIYPNTRYYIFNNRIENNTRGIDSYTGSYEIYIFDNIINNNTEYGITLTGTGKYDIYTGNNIIFENGGGINLNLTSGTNFVTGNNIYKNTAGGISLSIPNPGTASYEVANNVIWENSNSVNGGGIYAINNGTTGSVYIRNNEIRENTSPAGDGGGIYYEGNTTYSTITGNNIYGNSSSNMGNQLYVPSPATPLLNADNNWWGAGVIINDNEVYKVTTPGASVNTGTPAAIQFPVPDVPTI